MTYHGDGGAGNEPRSARIFQYFLLHETGTVKELRQALPDVPSASLYRHVKLLAEHSVLTVAEEHRIRGTVERRLSLNKAALSTPDEAETRYRCRC